MGVEVVGSSALIMVGQYPAPFTRASTRGEPRHLFSPASRRGGVDPEDHVSDTCAPSRIACRKEDRVALNLMNLDQRTRELMLSEIDMDVAAGTLYIGSYLSPTGQADYEALLREAVSSGDDSTLAADLRVAGRMAATTQRRKPKGGYTTAKVPVTAPAMLAEGEFNRFYLRGLSRRAIEDGIDALTVYRAKAVERPRADSEAKLGTSIAPAALLADLRASPGVDTALGLPAGPNSGLSARLPE